MNINIDDWNFKVLQKNTLAVDVFLDNGQHGLLEVFPLKNLDGTLNEVPETVMFGELSGETIQDGQNVARWISRPPQRSCPWSRVQVPPALWQQIAERIAQGDHSSATAP
ncbi:MAG: hypothetical protein ABI651_17205 [Verrucomicrobiota bacterium]